MNKTFKSCDRKQMLPLPPCFLNRLPQEHLSHLIEKRTHEDIAFHMIAANQHPDHDSICEFRKRHLQAPAALFVQILNLCQEAGLVQLGHVALDGTKISANASKHKAMSSGRMKKSKEELEKEIAALV